MTPRKRTTAAKKTAVPPIDFEKIAEETGMAERSNRFGRGRGSAAVAEPAETTVEETTPDAPAEQKQESETVTDTVVAVADSADKPAETTSADAAKRAARPSIDVGAVVVRKSQRTDFTTRATPTESSPVYLAVKGAEFDEPTDILVENDDKKIEGVLALLRRSGQAKFLNVGIHIAPKVGGSYPTEEQDGKTYAVITFKKSAERQVRVKTDNAGASAPATTEAEFSDAQL